MENSSTYSIEPVVIKNVKLPNYRLGPERDWKIILFSTLALIALAITISILVFTIIDKGEAYELQGPQESVEKTLDISLIRATVSYYQNKTVEFERIKNEKLLLVDPSI